MSCIQSTPCRPSPCVSKTSRLPRLPSKPCISVRHSNLPRTSLKYQRCAPVCLFGGKEKPKGDNEDSPWKALENAMGSFKKEQSLEDVLREQIAKNEYADDGGSGRKPPQGGGGGGGDSGGSEDEGAAGIMDETLQVILATAGFIFMYIYIINGEEMTRLAKDYIKYIFGGSKSVRLRRAMYKWGRWYKKQTEERYIDKYWLEKEILRTTTWWDSPEKYRRILRHYSASQSDNDNE